MYWDDILFFSSGDDLKFSLKARWSPTEKVSWQLGGQIHGCKRADRNLHVQYRILFRIGPLHQSSSSVRCTKFSCNENYPRHFNAIQHQWIRILLTFPSSIKQQFIFISFLLTAPIIWSDFNFVSWDSWRLGIKAIRDCNSISHSCNALSCSWRMSHRLFGHFKAVWPSLRLTRVSTVLWDQFTNSIQDIESYHRSTDFVMGVGKRAWTKLKVDPEESFPLFIQSWNARMQILQKLFVTLRCFAFGQLDTCKGKKQAQRCDWYHSQGHAHSTAFQKWHPHPKSPD